MSKQMKLKRAVHMLNQLTRLRNELQDWSFYIEDAVEYDEMPKVLGEQVAERLYQAQRDTEELSKLFSAYHKIKERLAEEGEES